MKKIHLLFIVITISLAAFSQAPTINFFNPVTGSVGTTVTIGGSHLDSVTSFTIGGVPATIVSDNGTYLVGMVMPGSVSGVVSVTTAGGTAIAGGGFTVTPTLYPDTQQVPKLVGTGISGQFSDQGVAVAISADGNTAIAGGEGDNSNLGAAWIFTRYGSTWTARSKIYPSDYSPLGFNDFGQAVAISADGNTAIIGAGGDSLLAGASWIFIRDWRGVWLQQGLKLIGSDAIGTAGQGSSVALSADGNTAIIAGGADNSDTGAAWIFTRTAGVWAQQGAKLVNPGYERAVLGQGGSYVEQAEAVSISADGNTAIVGKTGDNNDTGAVCIYTRSGGIWTQQGPKLTGTGYVGASAQGTSVALSADGNIAIVGGAGDNNNIGAVWVFTRSNGIWAQQGPKLVASDEISFGGLNGGFGSSVSLSADGSIALLGAYGDNQDMGAAWIFTRTDSVWTQQGAKLVGTNGTFNPQEGNSVSLSADGNIALLGGPQDGQGIGATWVFANNTCCQTPAYSVTGITYNDTAVICLTDSVALGSPLQNIKVLLLQYGQVISQCYTSASGGYFFPIDASQTFNVEPDTSFLPFSLVCPDSGSYNILLQPSGVAATAINFGFRCPGVDYGVSVIGGSSFVPGDTTQISVIAGNPLLYWYHAGCGASDSGTVMTIISGPIQYIGPAPGALTPSLVSGDTLLYTISNLDSLTLGSLYILVSTDTSAVIGSPVCLIGLITPAAPDIYPSDDTFTECFAVVSSFDPNHKSVSPATTFVPGEWLTYTVHFQNTGTDTARNIVVRDTLSNYVDENTFQYIASSSKAIVQLFGKACMFTFPDINLPDADQNSIGSQGWIQYKVKTKTDLGNGTTISNKASIFFDYNPAIVTNTTTNVAQHPLGISTIAASSIHLYPNPNKGSFTLQTTSSIGSDYTISDMLGHVIAHQLIRTDTQEIDLIGAADGVYTLSVTGSQPIRFLVIR